MLEEAKRAYEEIFEVIEKHGDLCVFNVVNLKREAECHIFGLELKEKYGLNFKIVHEGFQGILFDFAGR